MLAFEHHRAMSLRHACVVGCDHRGVSLEIGFGTEYASLTIGHGWGGSRPVRLTQVAVGMGEWRRPSRSSIDCHSPSTTWVKPAARAASTTRLRKWRSRAHRASSESRPPWRCRRPSQPPPSGSPPGDPERSLRRSTGDRAVSSEGMRPISPTGIPAAISKWLTRASNAITSSSGVDLRQEERGKARTNHGLEVGAKVNRCPGRSPERSPRPQRLCRAGQRSFATICRASFFSPSGTASSKSRITAWVPAARALSTQVSFWPGTKSKDRYRRNGFLLCKRAFVSLWVQYPAVNEMRRDEFNGCDRPAAGLEDENARSGHDATGVVAGTPGPHRGGARARKRG